MHKIRNTLDHSAEREVSDQEKDDMYDTFIEFVKHAHFQGYGVDEEKIKQVSMVLNYLFKYACTRYV